MLVTDIGVYKGDTYFVELDGGEKIFIHKSIAEEFHIRKDTDIPSSAVGEMTRASELRKARERALYLLDVRDYGFVEMYEKLEKNYDEDICMEVCRRLAEAGLINDRRYARKLAEYYLCTKKFGYYRARQELDRRRIGRDIAEEALSGFEEGAAERLEELVEAKYERYLTSRKGVEKVKAALARLGYSYSEINDVLDLYDLDFDE